MKLPPWIELSEASERRLSVAALVAANALPLFGVLFLGWKTFDVVLLYWLENVVIGVLNLPRMILAWPDAGSATGKVAQKLFAVPFFCFHYGMFCMGHGAFIFELLTPEGHALHGEATRRLLSWEAISGAVVEELSWWQWLSVGAFSVSHLVSFFANYLGRGEWRKWKTEEIAWFPYGRIVLMHVAILVGGCISQALGSPVFVLVILVVGKTLMDLALHLHEHGETADSESGGGDHHATD